MNIRNRVKELRNVRASELRPNPKNWRTHPRGQQDALRGILSEIGMAGACLARELEDGSLMLIDGHLRAETATDSVVPVLVLDVSEGEADKILATLDPLTSMAEKDAEQLASLLQSLQDNGDTLAGLVWPDYVMDPLLTADWTPPEEESLPGKEQKSEQDVIRLTADQKETVDAAVEKFKDFHESPSLSLGECVALICQEYLDK